MAINLTDALNAATTKGKLADAKQIYLEGDNKNLQDAHKDNEDHLSTLDTRSAQIEESLKTIAATGGASNANAVIYDNNVSGLTAINVKGALDELTTRFTEIKNNVGLYNVDKNIPLGSGYYTSTTARAAIPITVRKLGLIITYKTDSTTSVTEQFIGSSISSWTTDVNWTNVGSVGGNKILEWNTDVATTRKQVLLQDRKAGIQISYKNGEDDWVNEQYIGTSFTDIEWVKDANWELIPNQKQLDTLKKETNTLINDIGIETFSRNDFDLQITDFNSSTGKGNVLIAFKNGEVFTKYFEIREDRIVLLSDNKDEIFNSKVISALVNELNNKIKTFPDFSNFKQLASELSEFYVVDNNGFVAFKIDKKGGCYYNDRKKKESKFSNYDYNMLLNLGQSLSVLGTPESEKTVYDKNLWGFSNLDGVDATNTQTEEITDSYMDETFGTDFKNIKGGNAIHSLVHNAMYYNFLLKSNNFLSDSELPNFVLASCGTSGTGIDTFLKDNSSHHYNKVIMSVKQGCRIAASKNKTFAVRALFWIQSESDYGLDTEKTYKKKLETLFDNLNSDIKSITGQYEDVLFICYNPATETNRDVATGINDYNIDYQNKNNKALQMIELSNEKKNVYVGTAMYQFRYEDFFHIDYPNGYKIMGSALALSLYNIVENGKYNYLYPSSISHVKDCNGKHKIYVRYDNLLYPPLQIKKQSLVGNENYDKIKQNGFRILKNESFDYSTDDSNIIENVSIHDDGTTIIITCSEDPTGMTLTYAWDGFLAGGNICDSAENYNPKAKISNGTNITTVEINNYLLIFKHTIS